MSRFLPGKRLPNAATAYDAALCRHKEYTVGRMSGKESDFNDNKLER